MSEPAQTKSRLTIAQWIIRITVAVASSILAAGIATTYAKKSELVKQIANTRSKQQEATEMLADLEEQQAHVESLAKRVDEQREQLLRIYRQYRDVDDIAENPSNLIVFAGTSGRINNSIRLTVPSGEHQLTARFTKSNPDDETDIEEKKLTYELAGPAAYVVDLNHPLPEGGKYRDPRQLTLSVTSNNSQFTRVTDSLFEPFPTPTSSRYDPGDSRYTTSFPNQYRRWQRSGKPGDTSNTSLLLMKSRCSNHRDAIPPFDLNIEIRLKSEGPSTADAVTVESFKYRRPKLFDAKYVGRGKYELTELENFDEQSD